MNKPKTIEEIAKETIELVNEMANKNHTIPVANNEYIQDEATKNLLINSDENSIKLIITGKQPQNKRKTKSTPRKPRKGMSIKNVSHLKLHRKMMTVLAREVDNLMVISHKGMLTDKQAATLVNYLKLGKKLLEFEDDLDENISDEELQRITSKSIKAKN